MSKAIFVIDTSYLLELFAVPEFSEENAIVEVRKRYRTALESKAMFIVPLPCLFELANHVADVKDGAARRRKAEEICGAVQSSFEKAVPWTITPAQSLEAIPEILRIFASDYVHQKVGLTDAFSIHEAHRLRSQNLDRVDCTVHIWTRDNALKAREPDSEPHPFI